MRTTQFDQTKQFFDFSKLLKCDLFCKALEDYLERSTLAPIQRILLTTDGTLTKILEAYLSEEIQMVKLSERSTSAAQDIPLLELKRGSEVIERKILLQGNVSKKNFLYAESLLVPERFDERFRDELLKSEIR